MTHQVLDFYKHQLDLNSLRMDNLGNAGGFSGAEFWKIESRTGIHDPEGDGESDGEGYCLRKWPANTDSVRLEQTHEVIQTVFRTGCEYIPLPFAHNDLFGSPCRTLLSHAGTNWQLEPWMPGQADYHENPSDIRLTSAVQALAKIHVSIDQNFESKVGPCPAIAERTSQLAKLINGKIHEIDLACINNAKDEFQEIAVVLSSEFNRLANRLMYELVQVQQLPVRISYCIRDVWHDHVLFSGDQVSGIVDFGALREDSRAVDFSRLLGSLCGDDDAKWNVGLNAASEIMPLEPHELTLLPILDRSSVMLSLVNWMQWLFVEGRKFESDRAILPKLRKLCLRLQSF